MKGRFAPSPTGHIHLGNVWIALLSYLSVKQQHGTFLVRMEDIDIQRSKRELGEQLLDDLEWLGFEWDEGPRIGGAHGPYWQSERYDYYEKTLAQWESVGFVYPCFCNRARIQSIASAPHRGEIPHLYDGHCRHLSLADIKEQWTKKEPSWRIKVEDRTIEFMDRWQGLQTRVLRSEVDDFVVKRGDGMFAYNLAVTLDDVAMGVTEIVRGADLLDTTAQQMYLYSLLGESPVHYGHAPLLIDVEGHRLSKRQKSITIKELRESGYSSERILGELCKQCDLVMKDELLSHGTITLCELVERARNSELMSVDTLFRDEIVVRN